MIWTKFAEGAWLVIVAIPLLVLAFLGVNRHYRRFARRLRAGVKAVRSGAVVRNHVLLNVDAIDGATEGALWYAEQIARPGEVRALHVPHRGSDTGIRSRWFDFARGGPRLEVLDASEGATQAILEEVWQIPRGDTEFVTAVVPEQFRRRSLAAAASRRSFWLKLRLNSEPGIVIADVPAVSASITPDGRAPTRLAVRVLVANVHAGSIRAVQYAQSLGVLDTRAVSFALDPDEARSFRSEWERAGLGLSLDLSDSPYRDVGNPAPRLPARAHRRPRHGRQRRHARGDRPRLGTAPAQPARALRQAPAALRAPGDPLERPLSALPLRSFSAGYPRIPIIDVVARYMTTIQSSLPPAEAFAYMADFSNAREWDPSVPSATRSEEGPVGLGSHFDLNVRFAGRTLPMHYEIVSYEEPTVVVLQADKPTFISRDTITVSQSSGGSTVHYDALLELKGAARLFDPLLQLMFKRTGDNAAAGMRTALNR